MTEREWSDREIREILAPIVLCATCGADEPVAGKVLCASCTYDPFDNESTDARRHAA